MGAAEGESSLGDRFLGSVLGAALGDALAFPYQHYSSAFLSSIGTPLTSEFAAHHTSFYPIGQYSDDTQVMLAVLEAILEAAAAGDEELADTSVVLRHLVPLWRDQLLIDRDESCAEAFGRLLTVGDYSSPRPLEGGRAEASPAGRALGFALWYHTDPERLLERVEAIVRLTHTDRRTLACSAAVAAAVAYNLIATDLILGDFLDQVAAAASRFDARVAETILDFPRVLSMTEYRCRRYFDQVYPDEGYPASDEGLGPYSVPAVLSALYFFLKTPCDYEATVDKCLRLGGQMDTTAFLAGAVSGARVGSRALPKNLVQGLHGGADLRRNTERLYRLWKARSH